MKNSLIYMPTFRSRQQENIVLSSFDFGKNMYPMVEIIKEFDRKRASDKQQTFQEVYSSLIKSISADKVFVDLPVYLNERASMKDEVLHFTRSVISNKEVRTAYLLSLHEQNNVIIPVISSYLNRTGEIDTIKYQVEALREAYKSICFKILVNHFDEDWLEIAEHIDENDYLVLDLDKLAPYPSPAIKRIVQIWNGFKKCPKIVLRSAINSDVQNVDLAHNEVVFEADNGLIEQYKSSFKADAFGDYCGIKKDDLTSGGAISPGLLFFDAVNNQFIGFKGSGGRKEAKYLSDFEDIIVPAVIKSQAVVDMHKSGLPYLSAGNMGWEILNRINDGKESGKSQAKFKRIAIEHYLHCIKTKIDNGDFI